MSIRFQLDKDPELRKVQTHWLAGNVNPGGYYARLTVDGYVVDFVHDEDALMYKIRFGMKRNSTKLERMLEREEILENLEKYKARYWQSRM